MKQLVMIARGLQNVEGMQGHYPWRDLAKTRAGEGALRRGLFGALLGLEMGKDSVLKDPQDLGAGRYLVVANDATAEIEYFRSRNRAKSPYHRGICSTYITAINQDPTVKTEPLKWTGV